MKTLILLIIIILGVMSSCEEPEIPALKSCPQPPSGILKNEVINFTFASFNDYEKIEILHSGNFVGIPKDGIHDNIYNWIYLLEDGPVEKIRIKIDGNLKEFPVVHKDNVKWEIGGAYIIYDTDYPAINSHVENENKIFEIHNYEPCVDQILFF